MNIQQSMDAAAQAHRAGRLEEAEAAYRQILSDLPSHAPAANNLALVLADLGRIDDAVAGFRAAAAAHPEIPQIHFNLGNALRAQGDLDAAADAYRAALAIKPDYLEALNNLSHVLWSAGRMDEAVQTLEQADALHPDNADVLSNLAQAYMESARLDDAVAAYDRAVAIRPDDASTASLRILALQRHPNSDPRALLAEQREWNHRFAEPLSGLVQPHDNPRDPDKRLRIGYVSPDFREHPAGWNVLPLVRGHDRQNFEVYCYASVSRPDDTTEKIRGYADQWRDIRALDNDAAAEMIRRDGIDILIDLSGHSASNRLPVFARKPAPVQVTFPIYPGGTGLQTMDYRLTDAFIDPPGETETFYAEKLIRLPGCYWCFDAEATDAANAPEPGPRPAKTAGFITFGSLNYPGSISEETVKLWAEIMRRVRTSRLIMRLGDGEARRLMLGRFLREGIIASRIEFVDRQTRNDYLAIYQRIDITLDTYPSNGTTATLDSLWMGVPVMTHAGPTAVGRAGWSIMNSVGLADLAAQTPEYLVEIAKFLAREPRQLSKLRKTLRDKIRKSALMDAKAYTQSVESAYRQMWKSYVSSPSPALGLGSGS